MRGQVLVAAVVVALAFAAVPAMRAGAQEAQGRVAEGLVVLYEFGEGNGVTVADKSGVGDPLNLAMNDAGGARWAKGGVEIGEPVLRTQGAATKLIEALQGANELTIEAAITPQNTAQNGPTRIVSLSKDPHMRNFTLGQEGTKYILRLRTTQTDVQGTPEIETPEGAVETRLQHVVATYGAGVVTIYVDGEPKAQMERPGDFSTWDPSFAFLVGNEATLDRLWRGTVRLVAIYDRALSAEEVARNFAALAGDAGGQ